MRHHFATTREDPARLGEGLLVGPKIWHYMVNGHFFKEFTPHPIDSRREGDMMNSFRLEAVKNLM